MIIEFRGSYRFLSNFYPSIIHDGRFRYNTNEHYYQAMKSPSHRIRRGIANLPFPGQAKRLGRTITMRPDWEEVKFDVMYEGLCKKFMISELRHKLIATYPQTLVEGNYWEDKIWGFCLRAKKGRNMLGRLLMKVRTEIMEEAK